MATAKTTPSKKNNTLLYVGIGASAIAGIIALVSSTGGNSKTEPLGADTFTPTPTNNNSNSNPGSSTPVVVTSTAPPPLNKNLVLRKGSKGQEVVQLQKLLGITADGIFGSQTEAALFSKKGVKEITLNNFSKLVTINNNAPAIGSKLMSNNQKGTTIYKDAVKADKSHYAVLPYDEETTIGYGKHVGVLKGVNGTKTWFLILWEGTFGSYYGWVKASEVKKY